MAEIEIINTNKKILMDQTYLEPIVPQENSTVMIINGINKGKEGLLEKINLVEKNVVVVLSSTKERVILKFNQICKYQK